MAKIKSVSPSKPKNVDMDLDLEMNCCPQESKMNPAKARKRTQAVKKPTYKK